MTTPLLTEGDLGRGQPRDLTSPHWRCGIVHTGTGACVAAGRLAMRCSSRATKRCKARARSTRLVEWTGATERAMVVDGYRWSRLPGTNVEVRALTDKPLALRYRPPR
jgi:hypothetical protein